MWRLWENILIGQSYTSTVSYGFNVAESRVAAVCLQWQRGELIDGCDVFLWFLGFCFPRRVWFFSGTNVAVFLHTHTHTLFSSSMQSTHVWPNLSLSVIISFKENKRAELECKRKSGQSEERSLAFTPPHFFFFLQTWTNVYSRVWAWTDVGMRTE